MFNVAQEINLVYSVNLSLSFNDKSTPIFNANFKPSDDLDQTFPILME